MVQKEVSVNCLVAWVGWVAGIITAIVSLLYPNHGVGPLSVLFVGAAATLHVRGFVHGIADREQRAFDFGRESVRPLR